MVSGCGNSNTEVQSQTATESIPSAEEASSSVDSMTTEDDNESVPDQKDESALEQEATAAIQKCWDFPSGKIQPGATRTLLKEAKDKINACDSNEFKNSLQQAVDAVDRTLSAQEKEQLAEQSAQEAIQKCWNFSEGTLQGGATRALLNDAKNKINACSNADFKESLQDAIVAVDQALAAQEREQAAEQQASEAIQKCWNFSEGRLQDGANRNLLNDAKNKISACSNEEFKNSLQDAVTATDQALTANEEAERQQAAANNNAYGSGNGSYDDDSNWDAYQAQKERDWDQYQREKEESYQRNRGKSYEERRRDYDRVYQDNQRRREDTYRRYH